MNAESGSEHGDTPLLSWTGPHMEAPAMVTRRDAEEIARLGDTICQRDIRSEVEDAHDGDFVAIDVESGSWALAGSELDAAERLRERQPDGGKSTRPT